MEIPKDQILTMLKERGQGGDADQADKELPDQVDPEQHAGTLQKFGLDPQELIGKLGGGLGGKFGL